MNIKCIKDEAEFLSLAKDWNNLADKADSPSIFHRHEWYNSAWQWKKTHAKLNILVISNDDIIIGICPLILQKSASTLFNINSLEFLTVPDTQFCDLVTSKDNHEKTMSGVMRWLTLNKDKWDLLNLNYLRTDSTILKSIREQFKKAKFENYIEDAGENPYVDMSTSWKDFYSTRSRRLKKGNNLAANKLEREGSISIEWTNSLHNKGADITNTLNEIIQISEKSWKNTTGFSLNSSGPNEFIKKLSNLCNETGCLSVWILRLNNTPIAMEYQIIYNNVAYALRSDFIDEYSSLSPGTYLNWKLLEELFNQKISRYYMGPGNNKYKLRWTDVGDAQSKFFGYSNNWRATLTALIDIKIKPALKSILNKNSSQN